ncbi:MAG: LPS-assembly protein LptD [Bradyrhizobiaceae bacterium]|nr:LPS-assembly protein LptD [Bradyrhizobiaceae bacterium]
MRPGTGRGRTFAFALAAALACVGVSDASAQQSAAKGKGATNLRSQVKVNPSAKMLVQANELVYDQAREEVSAVGKVQIYYDGSVLEADRVTHFRKTNRLEARGNVRYQTKDGNVIYTDHINLDADFRDGFVQSLLIETPERTRIAAASAERRDDNITELRSGAYTACEPCKDDPSKPPLWQVKAKRIVHNEKERVIHYEDASIEFFGVPVAYFPYFWHPDPTVKRQTGFLLPTFFSNSRTGTGVSIPYYWALAPNYDLTVAVAPMTRQIGPLVSAEWRHRLVDGAYSIRAAGIFQQDSSAFRDASGVSPGDRDFRGSVETEGHFRINKRWAWGWDATLLTDKYFLSDYSTAANGVGSERTSQIYLTGQGDRSYFDARAMGFIGFGRTDDQDQLPIIHPVLDYSRVLEQPVLGGEVGFNANFVSLTREQSDFDRITAETTGEPDALKCLTNQNPNNCLMRGMAGDYTRFSTELYWRRTITNPWGVVFKPFASGRLDLATRDTDDAAAAAFVGGANRESMVRAMPAVGAEARWPFISVHSWGTQIIEPIGQIVVRPNETHIGQFPNEDAQSLVFDDTNLFSIDKYSGYDRVEGGTRANAGVQYTANIHRFGMINMLFGQSYHLAGKNSYAFADSANTGLESGLENDVSDYVSRIYFQPVGNISYAARARFDKNNFDVRRLELETRATFDKLSLATIYARYDAQPQIGYVEKREGIYQTAVLKLHENWSIFGGARYDLNDDKFDLGLVGLNYVDECFAATFSYLADYSNFQYTKPVHKIMMRVNLRTLGGTGFSTHVGSEKTN